MVAIISFRIGWFLRGIPVLLLLAGCGPRVMVISCEDFKRANPQTPPSARIDVTTGVYHCLLNGCAEVGLPSETNDLLLRYGK